MSRRKRIVFKPFTAVTEDEPKSALPMGLGMEIFAEAGMGPTVRFTLGGSEVVYVTDRETLETRTEPFQPRAFGARI